MVLEPLEALEVLGVLSVLGVLGSALPLALSVLEALSALVHPWGHWVQALYSRSQSAPLVQFHPLPPLVLGFPLVLLAPLVQSVQHHRSDQETPLALESQIDQLDLCHLSIPIQMDF